MKRLLASLVFSLLFFWLMVLLTVRFLFLNADFLFASLTRHRVYQEVPAFLELALSQQNLQLEPEERQVYEAIAAQVTPELVQKTTEENVGRVLNFLHGRVADIEVYLPTGQLGINKTDIYWSTNALQNPQMQESLNALRGVTKRLVLACLVLAVILLGLFVYLKSPGVVIATGSLVLAVGLIGRIAIFVLLKTLPQETEPAAKLLALLGNSLLADAVFVWLMLGSVLLTGGIIWKLVRKLKR